MSPTLPASDQVEIVGHAGAGAYHPPNSAASIRAALDLGVDRIELDVLASRDGVLVLLHDDHVTASTGERRQVDSLPLHGLRAAHPGLLTLDDAAELVAGRTPLLLDAKRPSFEPALVAAIRRHRWAETAVVSTTHAATVARLHRTFPHLRLGISTGHWAGAGRLPPVRAALTASLRLAVPLPLLAALAATGATETMLHHRVATAPLIALLHSRGYRVNLWTVDDPLAIRRALALRPDAIISNRPDLVRRIVDQAPTRPETGQ